MCTTRGERRLISIWLRGYKAFFHAQLNTKFQLIIKAKMSKREEVSGIKFLICAIYHAIVGILTFMSRINFVLS